MSPYANRYISILYRRGQRYIAYALRRLGLDLEVGQMPPLLQSFRHPGITQEGISAVTGLDKGTTARSLRQLEENGYIRREEDPHDRRINHIYPTDKAYANQEKTRQVMEGLHEILYRGFSEEEIAQTVSFLERMARNISEYQRPLSSEESIPPCKPD